MLFSSHADELITHSAIAPNIAQRNFFSFSDDTILDNFFISPKIERRNTGRVSDRYLWNYRHFKHGGWFAHGVDLFDKNLEFQEWGTYKPNQPRTANDGKEIKYEHPPKSPTQAMLPALSFEDSLRAIAKNGNPQMLDEWKTRFLEVHQKIEPLLLNKLLDIESGFDAESY